MQYLAQWRMQAAARLLLETRATVATIALDIGYESEAAFSRAFKRRVGQSPGGAMRRWPKVPGSILLPEFKAKQVDSPLNTSVTSY